MDFSDLNETQNVRIVGRINFSEKMLLRTRNFKKIKSSDVKNVFHKFILR